MSVRSAEALRVPAQHAYLSLAERQCGGQQPQQGGLARAVGAEQPDHAGFQVQVDVGQCPGGAERAPGATQADRSGHRYLQGRSWRRWRRRTRKIPNDAAASTRKATWIRAWSTAAGEAGRPGEAAQRAEPDVVPRSRTAAGLWAGAADLGCRYGWLSGRRGHASARSRAPCRGASSHRCPGGRR